MTDVKENKASASKAWLYVNSRLVESNKNWKQLDKHLSGVELVSVKPLGLVQSESSLNEIAAHLSAAYFIHSDAACAHMETQRVAGTLRILKPSLYVFPARVGDSAFFTVNGFSMLVNGGYERLRPCFWKFVNSLQQIDAVLITHADSDALGGLSALFAKKLSQQDVKPAILTVLGNLIGSKSAAPAVADLAAGLIAEEVAKSGGHSSDVDLILEAIEKLSIKLVPLVKSVEPGVASSRLSSAQVCPLHFIGKRLELLVSFIWLKSIRRLMSSIPFSSFWSVYWKSGQIRPYKWITLLKDQ